MRRNVNPKLFPVRVPVHVMLYSDDTDDDESLEEKPKDDKVLKSMLLALQPHYRVIRRICKQPAAVLHEATDLKSRARVCLKIIHHDGGRPPKEARILAKMAVRVKTDWRHLFPRICAVYTAPGSAAIVTRFEKEDSFRRIRRQHVVPLMRQLLQAVAALHAAGIMHRDVKPSNLFYSVRTRRLILGDYDLATEIAHLPNFQIYGTDGYIAPEVRARQGYDQRADLWSCGAVLGSLVHRISEVEIDVDTVDNLRAAACPGWPEAHALFLRLTEPCPDDRISSAEALAHQFFRESKQHKDKQVEGERDSKQDQDVAGLAGRAVADRGDSERESVPLLQRDPQPGHEQRVVSDLGEGVHAAADLDDVRAPDPQLVGSERVEESGGVVVEDVVDELAHAG